MLRFATARGRGRTTQVFHSQVEMDQLRDYADDRLLAGCVYCGGREETKDHVPSRIFLDRPYPPNLPVVPACNTCNNGFSLDEVYLACLIEAVIAGTTDPHRIRRSRVAAILRRSPALRARIEASKYERDGETTFIPEPERVRAILRKLAIGHAAFELSFVPGPESMTTCWCPLHLMSDEDRQDFNAAHISTLLGEVGSRGVQRGLVTTVSLQAADGGFRELRALVHDWVDVQDGRYRYLAVHESDCVAIRIAIAEYLACEVHWAI